MDNEIDKQEPSSTESREVKVGDKVWVLAEVELAERQDLRLRFQNGWTSWAPASDCRPVEPLAIEACTKAANDQLLQSLKDYPFGEPSNSPKILDGSIEAIREAFEDWIIPNYDWDQSYLGRNENRYFDSSVEMAWQAFQAGSKYQSSPLAPSPCMDGVDVDRFVDGIMEARGRASDALQVGDAVRFVWPGDKWHRTEGTIISPTGDSSIFLEVEEYPFRFKSDCGTFERWCSVDQLERIDKADPVNPSHYKQGGIECIEAIKAATGEGFVGYVWGNVLKYLWRWPKKGGVHDLKKARWYLDRLIKEVGE
jgi:hypothetical protein